ncbi:hypothetical protein IFM61606_07197 [Aspergillus udagawae]|uniref:Clock-controlled protein 6 n=1 Tax=Aspergillus udagawae TaxID=91492 RepID=A0A8E0UT68_9EURO|nr:uncharacterized protein Aud_000784 [Aspergillus udagawae]GFF51192.1 hypothetical protein IFM51744_07527 [Aspergillus udagawae]GFF85065.1 hypothetical protein IFM53868_04362 [Aspergillus udagawae]GFG11736.1 hypothetical protein IFM5058_05595 [Aspergillus udagawae]GFG27178.1 hypothetical protein IFM61606_07197 [Aspergillus udagawae]GIC84957.1 hypothetical protein Aud_000784 [Aspergillus udagawae]
MRFFAAVLATLAVGAIAADAVADEDYSTVMVTETTTYCPKATSAPVPELSSSAVPSITVSNGVTYSISRPLITSTITRCNKCPSSTPLIHTPTPSSSSIVVVPTSHPVIPSGADAKSTGSPVPTTPVTPLATGAASRAAVGAGAGLAGVFALAAYLL